jgi:hypothetical protein
MSKITTELHIILNFLLKQLLSDNYPEKNYGTANNFAGLLQVNAGRL